MIYLNGQWLSNEEAKISTSDRGFLLADGLFETMRAYQGKIFCLKEHWERLRDGAKLLGLPVPINYEELNKIAHDLLVKNNLSAKEASLRLTLTRGSGPRGLVPPDNVTPTIMLTSSELSPHSDHPISIHISSIKRNEHSPLCNIKSLCYLDNVLARKEALQQEAAEAIMLNTQEKIAGASAANVFIVTRDGHLVTPQLKDGALPGITRKTVISLAHELNIPVEERAISQEELFATSEIFLTNSLIEIQSVNKINKATIKYNVKESIAALLKSAYKSKVNKDVFHQPPLV